MMGKSVRFLDFVSRHRTQSVPTPKVTSLSDPDAGQKSQPHPNNTCYNDDISDIKFNRYYREINADAHHTHGSALVAEVGGGESQCPAIQAMPIQTPPPGMDAKELVPRNHSTYFRPIVKSYVPLGSGRGGEESKSVQVLAKSVSISVTGKGVDVEHKNQASEVTESQFSEDMSMKNKTNMLSKSVMCGMTAEETAMAKQMHVSKIIALSRSRRILNHWMYLTKFKRWGRLLESRDEQIWYLLHKADQMTTRSIFQARKRRFRHIFAHWMRYTNEEKREKCLYARAMNHFHWATLRKSMSCWVGYHQQFSHQRQISALKEHLNNTKIASRIFHGWKAAVVAAQSLMSDAAVIVSRKDKETVRLTFCALRYVVHISRLKRISSQQIKLIRLSLCTSFWKERTRTSKHVKSIEATIMRSSSRLSLSRCFLCWRAYVDGIMYKTLLKCNVIALNKLEDVLTDNKRLAKIVDYGTWGDHQLDLLTSAARLLREERDALAAVMKQFPWTKDPRIARRYGCAKTASEQRTSTWGHGLGSNASCSQPDNVFMRLYKSDGKAKSSKPTIKQDKDHIEESIHRKPEEPLPSLDATSCHGTSTTSDTGPKSPEASFHHLFISTKKKFEELLENS